MSEIESKVKAIIVDKLGVDEAEVKPEARQVSPMIWVQIHWIPLSSSWSLRRSSAFLFLTIRQRRLAPLLMLSLISKRTQNKLKRKSEE